MKKEEEGRPQASSSPRGRRPADQAHPGATQIGPGTSFLGNLSSSDAVEVRGTLEGDCHTSGRCTVHEGGRVLGNIDAAALVVAGTVEAGLLSADKVELRASASVVGTIRSRMVVIADGAFYQGSIEGAGAADDPPLVKDARTTGSEGPRDR
jgi:cytoskeletal protein CcmA (bactofilin family)